MLELTTGAATAIITFMFSYSYLNEYRKVKFNRYLCNWYTDVLITVSCFFLMNGTQSGLMTVLGLGLGLSLSIKFVEFWYGKGDGGFRLRLAGAHKRVSK